jgi:hypothetical protein
MEAVGYPDTLEYFSQTTRRYIPRGSALREVLTELRKKACSNALNVHFDFIRSFSRSVLRSVSFFLPSFVPFPLSSIFSLFLTNKVYL